MNKLLGNAGKRKCVSLLLVLIVLLPVGAISNALRNAEGVPESTASSTEGFLKEAELNGCFVDGDGQESDILASVVKQGQQIAKVHKSADTSVGKKSESASDPTGFVLISDVIPSVVMEARYYSTYNFVGKRVDGYEEPVVICTREAADALKRVAADLEKKGYRIKVFDAYRPQKAVDHFCRWAKSDDVSMKKVFYPNKAKGSLFPTYIARKSGHTKGSTFDLTIVDAKTGKDVDMGGPFDFFGEKSHYAYPGVTVQQKANRKTLRDAMTAHGFKSYSNEWWHFTLIGEPYPSTYFTFPVNSSLMK